jgi:uncharacterized protein with GYD domain
MKTYILLTKLSPELSLRLKDRKRIGTNWLDSVKVKCPGVKFIAHYALLGQYDFLDIYEAKDDETAAKISILSRENGASEAQSLTAIPYKRYLELIDDVFD